MPVTAAVSNTAVEITGDDDVFAQNGESRLISALCLEQYLFIRARPVATHLSLEAAQP